MIRAALILALLTSPAFAAEYRVIDGDTIEVRGKIYRFADWDAPEIRNYGCMDEYYRGRLAKVVLEGLMQRGAIETTGEMCGWGRPCIRGVLPNGKTFGEVMVGARVAQWDIHINGKRTGRKPDWCEGWPRVK